MATYLYRLGRFAFRRRRLVILIWLGLLAAGVTGAVTLSGPTAAGFSIPGTESQRAADLLHDRFPQAGADSASARIVFQAPPGQKLAGNPQVQQTLARLTTAPQVAHVIDPFAAKAVSPDGRTGYAQVTYTVRAAEITPEAKDAVDAAIAPARASGLTVEYGGEALQPSGAQHLTEVIGIGVAAVVLLITFGSLVAAGLPLLSAIIGVGIGVTAISAASGFVDIGSGTSILALMIGLAVSIDYALFIMMRYRHELSTGLEPEEATGRAVGTAGSAVVFAGMTVVIALAGLFVVGIPFLTQMGLAAAFTVIIAVGIALTLLPAMLGFAGPKVFSGRLGKLVAARRTGRAGTADGEAPARVPAGRRWVRFVTKRPLVVLLVTVIGLGIVAIPATDLKLGLPNDSSAAPDSTQRKAYDLLTEGFGQGFNGPLIVVVDAGNTPSPQNAASTTAAAIRTLPDVKLVSPPRFNPAGNTALLTVIPDSGPSATQTSDLVKSIRALPQHDGAEVAVTGATAISIDISDKLGSALLPYLTLIVGLAFLLLTLVFRSLLVPLKATLGFLLSVAATFGALVAVFQWGWFADLFGIAGQTGPIISMLPIFLIGVVFGLAMDYQIFLVTRMREEHVHGAEPQAAVVDGFSHGARVVTAAAVIMTAVFSGFILSDQTLIREMGFGLALAVLIDAFVVRMTVVPAVMALLGKRAWSLPRWLDRILPRVDVEGDSLRTRPPAPPREPELVSGGRDDGH
ncbi:MMPL family transporter [Kribbella solani]|uniref:MMPL family transporter n=1 Tax=Kribbella solani TaxID=236067 RepID=UPI0029A6FE40|nr:MMPL family transporter [Kribbella solani]MDX2970353.1 MMPL family transporter [Kribbella solani]MDX3002441.1 MMPL family transporter [Kribbella solani]